MILFAYILPYVITFITMALIMRVLLDPIEGFDETVDYFNIDEGDI